MKNKNHKELIKSKFISQFKQPDSAIHYIMSNIGDTGGRYLQEKTFFLPEEGLRLSIKTLDQDNSLFEIIFKEGGDVDPDNEFTLRTEHEYEEVVSESLVNFVDRETIKFTLRHFSLVAKDCFFEKMNLTSGAIDDEGAILYNIKTGIFSPALPWTTIRETGFADVINRVPMSSLRIPGVRYIKFFPGVDFLKELDSNTSDKEVSEVRRNILMHRFSNTDSVDDDLVTMFDIIQELSEMEERISREEAK